MKSISQDVKPPGPSFMGKTAATSSTAAKSTPRRGSDRPLLSQSALNIDDKKRSNSFPWRGQFSPQLVEAHLEAYVRPGDRVLDPFVGSGTVMLECARRNIEVFGAEINPAAAIMARTFLLTRINYPERGAILGRVDQLLSSLETHGDLPLFKSRQAADTFENLLCRSVEGLPHGFDRLLLETLVVLLDFHEGEVNGKKLFGSWRNLKEIVSGLPFTEKKVHVALSDARNLPVDDGMFDFVITSPPYINVFNYHQQFRASVEALQWKVLALAHSEIGANRKHRGNRFFTVVQYCLDMALALLELSRVCRPDARVILVVGRESNVRKTPFFNGRILRDLVQNIFDLEIPLQQERVFTNRFGKTIYEDIIHIKMRRVGADRLMERTRRFAAEVLRNSESLVPPEARDDHREALEKAEQIDPSPLFRPEDQPISLVSSFDINALFQELQ